MNNNRMILGENQFYSLDCYETNLNNNVLVVGASGSGKTRSIVEPNLLEATGSYIISDPKGSLYEKYNNYLTDKGYIVKKLDFTNPLNSCHYNFFHYIKNTMDIVKVSHMLVNSQDKTGKISDPFWDEAAQLLLQSVIAYLKENWEENEQNLGRVLQILEMIKVDDDFPNEKQPVDILFEEADKSEKCVAVKMYQKFRIAADKTLRSILITLNARIGLFDIPEIHQMTRDDTIDIASIGQKKTALFVVVSDTDRSMDTLVNLFFTQAMNELCRYADKECKKYALPVPVRFILDDFATNCKIGDFPRIISSIRSRNISTMLMIQAESQLEHYYGKDSSTIISNCDTYVYLGGNDVATAKNVAERCDIPAKKILNMPVGACWIFRRGQGPISCKRVDVNELYKQYGPFKERNADKNIRSIMSDSTLVQELLDAM